MRISILSILVLALFVSYANTGKGQDLNDKRFSVRFDNTSLKDVFTRLSELTEFNFAYRNADIRPASHVTYSDREVTLGDVLTNILPARALRYVQNGYNVIIVKAKDTVPSNYSRYGNRAMVIPASLRLLKGQVLDSITGLPLAGAVIRSKSAHGLATTSDNQGRFELRVPKPSQYITTEYIGYTTKTTKLQSGIDHYTILLASAEATLNSVVVNGIFDRPMENFTGAATQVTAEQLRQVSNRNVLDALKSIDPSFRIPENLNFGSDPNHLASVEIRGGNSINSAVSGSSGINLKQDYESDPNLPLFILDGFEVSLQKVYDLDMTRIKSVDLLKDAAATAIYGSKAANGVLVITTFAPKPGRLRLSYNGNFTLNMPDLTSYDLLNAMEKVQFEKAAGVYTDIHHIGASQENLDILYSRRLAEAQRGVNTYWLSQPLRTAFGQKHSINVEGGDQAMRYSVDLSYNNDASGVMKGSGRTNYSAGVQLVYNVKKFRFQNRLSVAYNHSVNSPYGSFGDYSKLNPYWRPYDSLGNIQQVMENYDDIGVSPVYNPMYDATLHSKDLSQYLNITENFQAEWNMGAGFKTRAQFSLQTQKDQYDKFVSALANQFASGYSGEDYFKRGSYTLENGNSLRYQGTLTLNYGKAIGKNTLYGTAGFQVENSENKVVGIRAVGFPNDRLDDINYANLYEKDSRPYGTDAKSRSVGYLANASYAYDNRYLLDASFRMDGSSKFGTDSRYAPFWSLGLGWNMHKEAFMQTLKWINQLKLRASYGQTGSQNFDSYMSLTTYKYLVDERYRTGVGAVLLSLGNSDLQWQKTPKMNIGADMAFLNSRLLISGNYFIEKSDGLITSITLAPSSGFSNYVANLGKVQNKGEEIYLTGFLIKNTKKNIFWSITANLFHNENKILEISDALKELNEKNLESQQGSGGTTAPVLLYREGLSTNTIWAVRSLGIDPSNGYEVFIKKDGTLTNTWDPRDEVPVGNTDADIYGTFGTNVMYKGFSINIRMRTNLGADAYNTTLADRVENANFKNNVDRRVYEDRWKQPGDVTMFKGVVDIEGKTRTDVTKATSRFVQSSNSLYCDAITLGYEFPANLIKKWTLSRLQTYLYINNPFVVSSIRQERGLSYPFARTYSLTIQASF
ncbi:TonB-dependent receptor [Arachidicoccus ginsenosidivorans]